MLRAELRRAEPARSAELHRRAGAWHQHEGEWPPRSSTRSRPATCARPDAACGRSPARGSRAGASTRCARWLERFRPDQLSSDPALALTAATVHLADGDRDRAEHWATPPTRLLATEPGPAAGGGGGRAALRALVGRGGLARWCATPSARTRSRPSESAWRPLCSLLQGAGPAHARRPRGRAGTARGGRAPRRHRRPDRAGPLPLPAGAAGARRRRLGARRRCSPRAPARRSSAVARGLPDVRRWSTPSPRWSGRTASGSRPHRRIASTR